jgi:hypothetical protein
MGVPELAVTVGLVFPVTLIVAVFEQPAPLVPVTVYVVVPLRAVNGIPSLMPPLQLYKLAPVALKVTVWVWVQTITGASGLALMPTKGVVFTVIATVETVVQPDASLTVAVYVLLVGGMMLTIAPVAGVVPADHAMLVAVGAVAVKVVLSPVHKFALAALTLNGICGATVTVTGTRVGFTQPVTSVLNCA